MQRLNALILSTLKNNILKTIYDIFLGYIFWLETKQRNILRLQLHPNTTYGC